MNQIEIKKRMEELTNIYDGVKIFLEKEFSKTTLTCDGYKRGKVKVWVNDNFDKVTFKQLDDEGKEVFATEVSVSYQEDFNFGLRKTERKFKVECGCTGSIEYGDTAYIN